MFGISGKGKENIGNVVESIFDKIALSFIGNIPRLQNAKKIIFSTENNLGLAHLFIQAMQNKELNSIEKDVLKGLLTSADGYIESLKLRTKSALTERIDGLVREASARHEKVAPEAVLAAISEEMNKAKAAMQAIAEAESTKMRNLGTLMDITRVASSLGDSDPTVFFVVIKDGVACKECVRLHLMPDKATPKLWKFSELKQGYHKRGENNPSAFGEHPHCRCTLTYLSRGFGFNAEGRIAYIGDNHDHHALQNSKQ